MNRSALISCFQDTVLFSVDGPLRKKTESIQKNNKVYYEDFKALKRANNRSAEIAVIEGTSFAIAKQYVSCGRIAVLNFANPHHPGGGVENGAMAQEECLCRSSNLYPCLTAANVQEDYYAYHRRLKHKFFSDRLIYTHDVTVFKSDDTVPGMMAEDEWFDVDIITCAAPYLAKRKYTNRAALFELFKRRIKNIFEAAIDNNAEVLILGAFGCGAFRNPPDIVAKAFNEVIEENNYKSAFSHIVFAIKSTADHAPWDACPNLAAFQRAFYGVSTESARERMSGGTPVEYAYGDAVMPGGRIHKAGKAFLRYYDWQQKNPYFGKNFSILGDSISTLDGFNPRSYKVFYQGENCDRSGVFEMSDTWWGKVINFFGAELLINNAWSGSRVTMMPGGSIDKLFPAGISNERTSGLHIGNVMPDVIIVYLGVNDWANGVPVDCVKDESTIQECYRSFSSAYEDMLVKLKRNYPQSEIWCCKLCKTFISNKPSFKFPRYYKGADVEKYNDAIGNAARRHGCKTIHLPVPYDSLDGTHPNAAGMDTIAMMVVRQMDENAAEQFLECEDGSHDYVMTGQSEDCDCYTCRKCGKESRVCPCEFLIDPFPAGKADSEKSEYVVLNPEKTTLLYSDTLELYMCHTGKTVKIQKQQIEVGRENSCDLRFENLYIARRQATFFYENQSWFLRDNHATNGTYINGTKLQPMKKYQLAANDVIGFAGKSVEVVFYRSVHTIEPEVDSNEKAIAILEAAIKVFSESNFNDDPSLKLIIASLLKAPLYFPVEMDIDAMLGSLDPTKLKTGDTIQPQKDVKMRILTLKKDDGSEIVPMFTSSEKAQKHQSVSTIRLYPHDYMATLLQMNKTVVINPFDEARFIIVPQFLKDVLVPLIENAPSGLDEPNPVPSPVPANNESSGLENKLIDGKYRIQKRIGIAGPVEVYLAMNEHINQVCAVKACGKTGKNTMVRELILNEALAMMKLNHPAIPKIYDIVEDESRTYVIREYIQGETLNTILKNYGAQPVDRVMDWTKQLCDVLGYLHGLNPPHIYRDMKPANVLLQPDGRIKLIDFETMRLYDETKNRDTTILGTKGYAAPEQYGGAGQTDARADIFGLGMTMHYLLTGVDPIDPPYITQPIRKINPALPAQLEAIIQKCIEPDREKRYQTIDSLLKALNGEPEPTHKKGLFSKLFGKH